MEKIKAIDVLEVEDASTKVQVTLIGGETFEDSVDGGHFDFGTHFVGKSEKDSEKDDVNV